jgi:Xaa-Pro aminopeptidase
MMAAIREYNAERLTRAMDEMRVDAVVASSPWNVSYLSGVSVDFTLLTFLVTTRDGRQGLVINEADAYFMRNDTAIGDVRDYPYSDTNAAAAKASATIAAGLLTDLGLAKARIGLEDDYVPALYRAYLTELLPEVVFEDGAPAMSEARIFKMPSEVEVIRRAAYFTSKAINVGFAVSRIGDTERDVANAMQAAILRFGATQLSHTVCSAGLQSTVVHAHPLDKPIRSGEVIHVDFGGAFAGYMTDLSRNAVVEAPSASGANIYRKLWDIHQFLLGQIQPGVVARELFATADAAFRNAGLTHPWGTLGHSTGLRVHEGFEITRTSDRVIEAGMVLNIEPSHIEPGDARYHIEDTVLVTETGVEVLSNYDDTREMYAIR